MDITVKELKDRKDQGTEPTIIDVREPNERAQFNIGGKLIPLSSIQTAITELADKKEEEIVVYCRSGRRSALAKELLTKAGFKNVRNMEGGILAWIEEFGMEEE